MKKPSTTLAVALTTAMLALAGCSSIPASSSSTWSAYGGAWTMDQIMQFPSEQKVVGTIAAIGPDHEAIIDKEATMVWVPVTIKVAAASPDLEDAQFVVRVLPSFEGQPDLSKLEIGQYVLYLGDAMVQDTSNPGPAAGTVSWLLTIDSSGWLGATAERDDVHGNIKDYAADLGLILPEGLFTDE